MASRTSFNISLGAAAVVASTLVWVACGSSSSSTSEDGGGGSSSGSTAGGSSGTGGGSSGAVGSSSGSVNGGSSGSVNGGSSGSVGSEDGGAAVCPQAACPSSETCCADLVNQSTTCSGSCAPADLVACTGSADCAGSDAGTECCAIAVLNKGPDGGNSFPHGCTVESVNSFCGKCTNAPLALGSPALTCQTNGDASVEHVHVCTTSADCADEPSNTLCCPVFSYNICSAACSPVSAR